MRRATVGGLCFCVALAASTSAANSFWDEGKSTAPLAISVLGYGLENVTENTVDAFEKGIALGATGVEMSARLTADGKVALLHDFLTPDEELVSAKNFSDLPAGTLELATAIEAVGAHGHGMNIVMRNDRLEAGYDSTNRIAAVVVARIRSAGVAHLVLLSAFEFDTVVAAKAACDGCGIRTAWLLDSLQAPLFSSTRYLEKTAAAGLDALSPEAGMVDREMLEGAHHRGLRLFAWFHGEPLETESPALMQTLSDCGVGGFITHQVPWAIDSRVRKQPTSGAACERKRSCAMRRWNKQWQVDEVRVDCDWADSRAV